MRPLECYQEKVAAYRRAAQLSVGITGHAIEREAVVQENKAVGGCQN